MPTKVDTDRKRSARKVLDFLAAKTGMQYWQVQEFFDELYAFAMMEVESNREFVLPGFGKLVQAKGRPSSKLKLALQNKSTGEYEYVFEVPHPTRAKATSSLLANLESEFDDLLTNMQTTKSKRAVQKAFATSPAQLGRAAVKQASKKR